MGVSSCGHVILWACLCLVGVSVYYGGVFVGVPLSCGRVRVLWACLLLLCVLRSAALKVLLMQFTLKRYSASCFAAIINSLKSRPALRKNNRFTMNYLSDAFIVTYS